MKEKGTHRRSPGTLVYLFVFLLSSAMLLSVLTPLTISVGISQPPQLENSAVEPPPTRYSINAPEPSDTLEFKTIGRPEEPIVINGSLVPDLVGTSVNNTDVFSVDNDILVYVWDGTASTWSQIPFQIDERNDDNDSFVFNAVDGVFDANDEIVFMTADLGDRPSKNEWIPGCDAPRYEIEVTDPFDAGKKGWAYVYRSFEVETNFVGDYIDFDTAENNITASNYTMGFRSGRGMLLEQFNVTPFGGGDGTDLMDRMNLELFGVVWLMGSPYYTIEYSENDMYDDFIFEKDSYVRAVAIGNFKQYQAELGIVVASNLTLNWMFYRSCVNVTGLLECYINDLESMGLDVIIENLNMSIDHELNATPMDYFDSHGNIGAVNGNNTDDMIFNTTLTRWWEIDSSHGGYVCVWDMNDYQVENKTIIYDDNSSASDHPGAEPGFCGKSGTAMTVLEDIQEPNFYLQFFPINGIALNVGATYEALVDNPLLVSAQAQQPALWVDKIVYPGLVNGGETVQYTVYFNNTGTAPINFVWINDSLPSEVTYLNDSSVSVGGVKTGNYNWTFTNVAPGNHSFVINATVAIDVALGTSRTNWVYCDYYDGTLLCPRSFDWATFTIREPIITLEKCTDEVYAIWGEKVQYLLYFNNTGTGTAESVWINDSLPSEVTYVSDTSALVGGVKTGDYNWTFANVAPGNHSFMINTTLSSGSEGTVVLNEASLNYSSFGGIFDLPGSSTNASFIIGKPNITIAKTASLGTAQPGNIFQYKIYFNNTGSASTPVVWINDTIPSGVQYLTDTSGTNGGVRTGDYNWTFNNVAPGNHNFIINVRLLSGTPNGTVLTNWASLNYTSYAGTNLPGSSDSAGTIALAPDINVEKIGDLTNARSGDFIQYTIYFNNTEEGNARTIYITDILPPQVKYLNDTNASEGGVRMGFCYWRFSNKGFGPHSFVINGQILNNTTIGSVLTNTVFLNYTDNLNTYMPGSNDTFSTLVVGDPDTVEVSAFPSQVHANGTDTSLITAWVNDSAGNGVPRLEVLIEIMSGPGQILGNVTDMGDGRYTATYQAGTGLGTAVVRAFCAAALSQNESTTNILLINDPPVADAGSDQSVNNLTVSFDGTGSYDLDGTIVSYEWDFGDGANGTGPTPVHNYSFDGIYNVTLKVTDNHGANDTDTCVVIIDVMTLTFNTSVALASDVNGNGNIDTGDNITITVVVTGPDFNASCDLEVDVDETVSGLPCLDNAVPMVTYDDGVTWTGNYTVLGDCFTTSDIDVKGTDLNNNTDTAEDNATFSIAGDIVQNFVPGWNLISLGLLQPVNTTMRLESAYNITQLGATVVSKWDADNQRYINFIAGFHLPGDPCNFVIEEDMAIFAWFGAATPVTINGYAPGSRNVSLVPGWNLVGFMGVNTVPDGVGTLWASQVGCGAYDDIAYYSAGTFVHYIFAGTVMNLEPGRGYFVWSDVPTNLIYQ